MAISLSYTRDMTNSTLPSLSRAWRQLLGPLLLAESLLQTERGAGTPELPPPDSKHHQTSKELPSAKLLAQLHHPLRTLLMHLVGTRTPAMFL